MLFKIKEERGFNSEGQIFSAPVVAKKLNGWKVKSPEGKIIFLESNDIEVLSMTADEAKTPLEF